MVTFNSTGLNDMAYCGRTFIIWSLDLQFVQYCHSSKALDKSIRFNFSGDVKIGYKITGEENTKYLQSNEDLLYPLHGC